MLSIPFMAYLEVSVAASCQQTIVQPLFRAVPSFRTSSQLKFLHGTSTILQLTTQEGNRSKVITRGSAPG
jgi:hypothetical protein